MIAYLKGTIYSVEDDAAIVVVSDVGYRVHVPQRVVSVLLVGEEVELHTYQHIREDALDLYGFIEADDVRVFQQLIQVSGVGPRLGLVLLSAYSASDVVRAIMHGDTALLTSVSGVGKKTAERICLDLKDSVIMPVHSASEGMPVASVSELSSAIAALEALGYSQQEAIQALQGVDSQAPIEEQVRHALKQAV